MKKIDFPDKDPWGPEYVLPYYAQIFGPDILDAKKRAEYCQACFFAGNTLRLWNGAGEIKNDFITACALGKGQKVLLVGKYLEESGLIAAIQSLVVDKSKLIVEDITQTAIDNIRIAPKSRLKWPFEYFDSAPDKSFDRVILFSAASHIENWENIATQVNRVLKDDGRFIVAEDPLGGTEFIAAAHGDAHSEAHVARVLAGMGLHESDLPTVNIETLNKLFKEYLNWSRHSAWSGLYLFYGQKGGKDEASPEAMKNTEAWKTFLVEKPFASPWDFLTSGEISAWSEVVGDQQTRDRWAKGLFLSGGLHLCYDLGKDIAKIMFDNLTIRPGDKVLAIGEMFDELGTLRDLYENKSEKFEIFPYDVCARARSSITTGLSGSWNYSYADSYPDEFFDVVWIPQALHHESNWPNLVPKLLRVLKPGGQIMLQECRKNRSLWFKTLAMSGLMRTIAEKIYLHSGKTFDQALISEVITEDVLRKCFGGSLTDINSVERKGWITFWGKKNQYSGGDFISAYPYPYKKGSNI